jgi:hypothetical protein
MWPCSSAISPPRKTFCALPAQVDYLNGGNTPKTFLAGDLLGALSGWAQPLLEQARVGAEAAEQSRSSAECTRIAWSAPPRA